MLRIGAVALVVLVAAPAAAQPVTDAAPEAIHLEYSVPAGCPDQAAFVAAIEARAAVVVGDDGARTFAVTIADAPDGGPVTGSVVITAGDATPTTRELAGATCAETVDALALVVALAIEEQAAA